MQTYFMFNITRKRGYCIDITKRVFTPNNEMTRFEEVIIYVLCTMYYYTVQ